MSIEVNGYFLRERVNVGNFAAGGVIGTAAATVDIISDIGVAQTTVGQTLTLPTPTDPRNGRSVSVANAGTVPFVMNGISIGPGSFSTFEWHGTTWRTHVGLAGSDFWRDTTAARNVPDGTVDVSEGIVHTGAVHMGADGVAGDQGFHHEAIASYQGNGNFVNQLIQTTIPVDSSIMPTVFLKGYCYGTADTVDLQVSFYVYASPTSTTLNHVWTSSGSKTPTQIRLGYVGGFMAIELTWPAAEYFNRFEVSAYCDGNSAHQAEWFQGWTITSAVMPGTVVNPVVAPRKYAQSDLSRFDLQALLTLNGRARVSKTGQVSWDNQFRTMSAGVRPQELSGYHDIQMPAVGSAIPVSDGTTRLVAAATVGDTQAYGGILLNAWDTLWYDTRYNTGNGSDPARFRIQRYNDSSTTPNGLLGASGMDATGWVIVCQRDDSGGFRWGNGDTASFGSIIGTAQDLMVANWTNMKARVMGDGYFFSPGGNTTAPTAFGFTGTIRWMGGDTQNFVNNQGYVDVSDARHAIGVVAQVAGAGGTPGGTRTWRAMTAAEKPQWFGGALRGVNAINAATSAVIDLNDNEILYWVPDLISPTTGTWYIYPYTANTAPVHALPVAARQVTGAHSTIQVLLGGMQYALKAGDATYTTTPADHFKDAKHRQMGIQFNGPAYCRFTTANFFAGAAANGVVASTNGVMVSWDNSRLMYGISDGYTSFGNQYTWLDVPPAGTAIPVACTQNNSTRVVQTIGAHRYIPLGTWDALYWIPPAYAGGSTAVAGDWVISNYSTGNQHIPTNAVLVAKVFSAPNGSSDNKTRVKFADGSYILPGLALATATVAENDHAQGSGNWRPVVVAGQTGPGMTAALPAIAGVSINGAAYNIRAEMSDPRPTVVLDGFINITANVPDASIIGFLPGVNTRISGQFHAVTIRHANNNTIPGNGFISFENNTAGGQNGVYLRIYGASAGNVAAANGGAHGAGGAISLGGLHFHHN